MRMTLGELEQMALANSPIIAQYQSDVAGQVGTTIQAGAHPNPIVGYESDTVGSAGTPNYQGAFVTQLIKTAGKLQLAQAIENVDLMNTQLALRQARSFRGAASGAARCTSIGETVRPVPWQRVPVENP